MGCGAPRRRGVVVRAGQPPGPCCASLMRAAVLPLLERAAGKGPREAGGRNGLWCAPSARGCGARWAAPPGPCCASLMRAAVLPLLERAAGMGCGAPRRRGVVVRAGQPGKAPGKQAAGMGPAAPRRRGVVVRAGQPPGPCCASLMRAAVLPLLERAAGKGPREAGGRNGLWCAPSARGCGARWAAPGPCCASLMRAAVLPLLERAAGKGPREAGGRNGLWCAPSARGCGARCRRDGRGECVRWAARGEGPLQNRRTQGS